MAKVKRITRDQSTVAEELCVRRLEEIGLVPSDFRRYRDGRLEFGAQKKGVVRKRTARQGRKTR